MWGSEFNEDMDVGKVFSKNKLPLARMLSWSKSEYTSANPKNLVAFNANVITEEDGKIWYGDIDVDVDSEKLKAIAKTLGRHLYILREHDGRFDNEDKDFKFYEEKAIATIYCK